jgi:hypothetical protein
LKKLFILPALLFSQLLAAQPAWRQGLQYRLQAKLDVQQEALDGSMDLRYKNHSPDTLHFIWFHVWPNAYRNDKTSYSDQLIGNGKTAFYFSDKDKRGYINRLEFRVNGMLADIQDHPEYIDVIKLLLPGGLAPGDSLQISATFHVKLPYNFSGYGAKNNTFQISNWYPEPAVYDRSGWHPMPFLEQGGAYHEPADYEATIEVPEKYSVVAGCPDDSVLHHGNNSYFFSLKDANAFAWVAARDLLEKKDTVQLESGKIIALHLYYPASDSSNLREQEAYTQDPVSRSKPFIRRLSALISDYPYPSLNLVKVLHAPAESFSGLVMLEKAHFYDFSDTYLLPALAGQWFQAACLSNERLHPWMSEGFMQYYYERLQTPFSRKFEKKFLSRDRELWLAVSEKEETTQPISTPAADMSRENYYLVAGTKTAFWLKSLEDSLGKEAFDRSMHAYFNAWKFGHPGPDDFRTALERSSGKPMENAFEKLNTVQSLFPPDPEKRLRLAYRYFSARSFPANKDQHNFINIAPILGYNNYDHLMAGLLVNNYNLPENNFQFFIAPLYPWNGKPIEGLGRISYSWYPEKKIRKITIGINGARFSSNYAKDSTGNSMFEKFSKWVPYLRIDFKKRSARSTLEKWLDLKSYLIYENQFANFAVFTGDSLIHPNSISRSFRYVTQLGLNIRDDRVLYPYDARLEFQQSDMFYRINLNADYFFNYCSGGGMRVRFFAAKFGVWNKYNKRDLSRYEPKLLGVTGEEDYTYNQYFLGRTASYAFENGSVANDGLAAQQISIRDGGLKLRIDPYDYVQGRSADWVSALNFSTSLPGKLFPVPVPLRIFFDVDTYAEAWKTNAQTSRFLYTGGLQLSLFKNVLNIYAPLVYSSDFRDLIKSEIFWRKLTFSIDIQNLDYKKLLKKKAFEE